MTGSGSATVRSAPTVFVSPLLMHLDRVIARLQTEGGCQVIVGPTPPECTWLEFTPDQIEQYIRPADAIICSLREHVSRAVLEAAPGLRTVCSWVIGTENVDVEAATDLGIVVGHGAVPENTFGVAEAVVMLAAALLKDLPGKQAVVRDGGWRPAPLGHIVAGRTIGLVGLGGIGRAVVRRLSGWDCRVIGADPYISEADAAEMGVTLTDLDTVLHEADIVSLHVTLTDLTRNLIGARELGLMRPTSYLINTSRGGVVDEDALVRCLDEGTIAGAAIDVWREEPPRWNHPLRTHPRVIATAHSVGLSTECMDALAWTAAENVLRALRGEPPMYVRNPEVLPAWKARLEFMGRG